MPDPPNQSTLVFPPATPSHLTSLLPQIVHLHSECITQPTHTIATFLPPLKPDIMLSWWEERAKEAERGERCIILHLEGEAVAGVVMLNMQNDETAPFHGRVEKLLVRPRSRGRGVARVLMGRLEEVAVEKGKALLMLGTDKGNPAEFVYPKLGYVKVGEIPRYEISPLDGSLKDGIFFYKDMR